MEGVAPRRRAIAGETVHGFPFLLPDSRRCSCKNLLKILGGASCEIVVLVPVLPQKAVKLKSAAQHSALHVFSVCSLHGGTSSCHAPPHLPRIVCVVLSDGSLFRLLRTEGFGWEG